MDIYSLVVIAMIGGYLIGSIPFALIVGKLFYHIDVRKYGSQNLGSTNVARTIGPVAGIIVLILDILKGGLTPFIMYKIAEAVLTSNAPLQLPYTAIVYLVTGFFVALGHCHPCFANFKGGKAVACICGFLIFMNWRLLIVALLTFIIMAIISKIVSLSSITTALAVMICSFIPFFNDCYLFTHNELHPDIVGTRLPLFIYHLTILFLGLLLLFRHIENIRRLLKHEEKRLHFGSKKDLETQAK